MSKKKNRVEKCYNEDVLSEALAALNEGMTLREVANEFKIAKSTLHDKLIHKTPIGCKKGPPTV